MNTGNDSVLHTIAGPEARGEIVLYQPDETIRLEVRMEDETVWLTQAQMALLFGRDRSVIGKHINNCFREGELDADVVCANFAHTTTHGAIEGKVQVHTVTITVNAFNRAHDRFLLIDDEVYHIGASLKDLGKKWFAFTLMQDLTAEELINRI